MHLDKQKISKHCKISSQYLSGQLDCLLPKQRRSRQAKVREFAGRCSTTSFASQKAASLFADAVDVIQSAIIMPNQDDFMHGRRWNDSISLRGCRKRLARRRQ